LQRGLLTKIAHISCDCPAEREFQDKIEALEVGSRINCAGLGLLSLTCKKDALSAPKKRQNEYPNNNSHFMRKIMDINEKDARCRNQKSIRLIKSKLVQRVIVSL